MHQESVDPAIKDMLINLKIAVCYAWQMIILIYLGQ